MTRIDTLQNFLKLAAESPKKQTDSEKADFLEKLYNIDVNQDKKKYRNIVEKAHPESHIEYPSYDKLNGLIENENERQNITLNILNKRPTGNFTSHRYAQKELLLSLVRVANDLDNSNKEQLRALADVCLFQVGGLNKKAFVQTALLVAIPSLLGSLYVQQHMSFINEGFEKNYQKLIKEIDDLLSANSSWGVGYDYKHDFIAIVQDFKSKLTDFYTLYKKAEPIIMELERPRTSEELLELAKKPTTDDVVKAYNTLKTTINNMAPYLQTIETNFSSESYKARQIEDKGFLSSLIDKTQVLHGGKGLVADDFDDVVHAIPPLKKSLSEILDILKKAESIEKSAQNKLQEASVNLEEKPTPVKNKQDLGEDFEKEIDDLEKNIEKGLF